MTLELSKQPVRTGGMTLGFRELRNVVLPELAAANSPSITQETQYG